MFEVYRPSGAFSIMFVPLLVLLLAFGVGAAFLYQFLLYWIPLVYVSFILTLIFGACLGAFGRVVVKSGSVRNVIIGFLIGLVIGGGSYAGKFWFQYERRLGEMAKSIAEEKNFPLETVKEAIRSEVTFWRDIELRVKRGFALNGGAPIGGFFVYLIWLIEAGIVLGLSVMMPIAASREPYSEKLGQWAEEENTIMMLPIDNPQMVAQITQATNVDDLLTIPIPKSDETNQFAVYTVNSIKGQEMEDAYLTVKLTTITYDKEGNEQKKEQPLVKYAVLTSEQRNQLSENAELLNEAIAAYQQAKYAGELGADSTNESDEEGTMSEYDETET